MKPAATPAPFAALGLDPLLVSAVARQGYERPTPIQTQAIPHVLAGRDVLGCAQTGTGKTAAFALPILQRLAHAGPKRGHPVRALVLSPTRELAAQIGQSFHDYGHGLTLRHTVIFGGVGQNPQVAALRRGVDVLVATPGRLIDLLGQRLARLDELEILVLDEADRMLDMGFLPDVRRILAVLPKRRQTLFFSATMPNEIRALSAQMLHDPVSVAVAPVSSTAERVAQKAFLVEKRDKPRFLERLLDDPSIERALVFTRTKREANRVSKALLHARVASEAIHGNKSQSARERALDSFRRGRVRVLVATDIAARGLDVDGVTHVINMDIPDAPESYVHRIGRTARAGASGIALSLCSSEERTNLRDIERLIKQAIPIEGQAERLAPRKGEPAADFGAPAVAPPARSFAPAPGAAQRPRHNPKAPVGGAHGPGGATRHGSGGHARAAQGGGRPAQGGGGQRHGAGGQRHGGADGQRHVAGRGAAPHAGGHAGGGGHGGARPAAQAARGAQRPAAPSSGARHGFSDRSRGAHDTRGGHAFGHIPSESGGGHGGHGGRGRR